MVPGLDFNDFTSDENSTLTSITSLETLTTGHCKEHENLAPIYLASSGPPFAFGDEILCDASEGRIKKIFLLEADHPRYFLRLEDGTDVLDSHIPIRKKCTRPRQSFQGVVDQAP